MPVIVEDEEHEEPRVTVKEQRNEQTKTSLAGGIDGSTSLTGAHGKASASAKYEKTTSASTITQRQVVAERPWHRNGARSVQIGRLGGELIGPVMPDWKAYRVIPEMGAVSSVAASLKVKQRSINFRDIKIMTAPRPWLEPLRQLLSPGEQKRKRAFEILLAHLTQSALADYQDGLSATIAYHKLVFKPYEPTPLSSDPGEERKAIIIDEVALEGYLKVEKGREASALLALGVAQEMVGSIDDEEIQPRRTKGEYFIPDSAPLHALEVLRALTRKRVMRRSELQYPTLKGLKLVVVERGSEEVRLADATMTNGDYLLQLAVAKADCIQIARTMLKLNPLASGLEIAEAVSYELKLGWNAKGTTRRNGNAILRWMLWLEPYVVDAASSNKSGQVAYAMENQVGKGRPAAYRRAMEKELRRLVAQKVPASEIARRFGVSTQTVYGWKRHYRMTRQFRSP